MSYNGENILIFYALIFFGANVVCDENLTRKKIENSV